MSDLKETREIPCQCGTFNLNSYDLPPQNWVYDSSDGFIHTVAVCPEVRLVELHRAYLASEVLAAEVKSIAGWVKQVDPQGTEALLEAVAKFEAAKEGK